MVGSLRRCVLPGEGDLSSAGDGVTRRLTPPWLTLSSAHTSRFVHLVGARVGARAGAGAGARAIGLGLGLGLELGLGLGRGPRPGPEPEPGPGPGPEPLRLVWHAPQG